jgi:hypothetical protein
MDADGLESAHLHITYRSTNPKPLLLPFENKKTSLKRRRKLQSQDTWEYGIIQGRVNKISRSVAESVTHQAVHMFLSDTVITAPSGSNSKGHFVNLVDLVQSSPKPDALPFALEAVALASLGNRTCNSEVQLKAMRQYTISIHQLRKTNLSSNSDVLSVIACITLLGLYEVRS